ncbi:family 78 glycoside hydrolase catalytic domain [Agreia sp. VKM Ac-1783]|uniref:family 78 glycoside hydrolase catalytic domain n=1 Tax=Agreia sp. VKM Ac-1783 TaxID=1938889 RepID=UPI000A2AA94D|nr:family 78 glycoside hydrolase catalytic domain [Agreia sp. VKM Ac-1783]SMQ74016.1 alpha-L-rhamnosidase [Agreia sp. VKM Ac-1783]
MSALVTRLRAEHRREAHGLGTSTPRLSWWVDSPSDSQLLWTEFEKTTLDGRTQMARVEGAEQVLVDWPFDPLASREIVDVRARVGLADGTTGDWGEALRLETGLLRREDWAVHLVVPSASAPHSGPRPAWMLRAEFEVEVAPVRARLYMTAQGIYRSEINGLRVGDDELAPGWTSYDHRLRAQAYDVTPLLITGANAIGIELADGWFRGNIGFDGGVWDLYGSHIGIVAQLELTGDDGVPQLVDLADAWRASRGPTTSAGLYEGEEFDARLHEAGWARAEYDDSLWVRPELRELTSVSARIEHAVAEPVRQVDTLSPVTVEYRPNGRIRLDFGQNISGRLSFRAAGDAGHVLRLHHAEVLENDELAVRTLRRATSIDRYTFRGEGEEVWQPRFTIHGFRYAELDGWPAVTLAPESVKAVVLHTDMERTGWFTVDDPMLQKLHDNTVWSMRDNFVDLPTDCPQRDERMGWTGDIQVFAPAASYLYRSAGVLDSWLRDVADEQHAGGAVPNFVPWVPCGFPEASSAVWGDASAIVPWVMWEQLGDAGILSQQYASMRGWVEHLAARADEDGVIRSGFALGDWLDPIAPPEDPGAARTDKYLVTTAYLVRSARIVADVAGLLGDNEAKSAYTDLADRTLSAFRREWVLSSGPMTGESPTSLALSLAFDLFERGDQRAEAGTRLADLVAEGGHRIQTGFVGTPIICGALAETGHVESAYALLQQTECPSWLYPITMGATTIWERWDSMLPDGRVNPGDMTSFNHYALGAVVDFMHRTVAGLAPIGPGYRRVRIAPKPGGTVRAAATRFDSPYGRIEVSWRLDDDRFHLTATVPFGVTAEVVLPGEADGRQLGAGTHELSSRIRIPELRKIT